MLSKGREESNQVSIQEKMTNQTLSSVADAENISELKMVFTDPKNRKQLRVFCRRPKVQTENSSRFLNSATREFEYFVDDLKWSDKLP